MSAVTGRRTDAINGASVVIDHQHNQIHRGEFFTAGVLNTSVGNGASIETLISVGDDFTHLQFQATASGIATGAFFEGTTVSDNGTAIPVRNRNRASPKVTAVQIFGSPTVIADGTLITSGLIPGGPQGDDTGSVGGTLATFNEFILLPNTLYLGRITNIAGAAIAIGVNISFYGTTSVIL